MNVYCAEFGHAFKPWPKTLRLYCSQCGETMRPGAAAVAGHTEGSVTAPPAPELSPEQLDLILNSVKDTPELEAEVERLRELQRRAMNGHAEVEDETPLLEPEDVGGSERRRVPVEMEGDDRFQSTGL